MTASLKSEETSQDVNVSQGNQIVQKRFFYLLHKKRKEMQCNHNNFIFIQLNTSIRYVHIVF